MTKFFIVTLTSVFIGLIGVYGQNSVAENSKSSDKNKFQTLLDRKNTVVIKKSYRVEACSCAVITAWSNKDNEKLYAAYFYATYIDFDKLDDFYSQIDRIIQVIDKSADDTGISVNYSSSDFGFDLNYYVYTDNNNAFRRNIYLKFGSEVFQDKTTERLKKILTDIKLAQEKLILLGAK